MVARSSTATQKQTGASAPSGAIPLHGFALPAALGSFAQEIDRSRAKLELADDWDGDGSPGYAEATWRRAVAIAVGSAARFLTLHGEVPPDPAIAKGPDGSVDVLWRSGTKKLMVNVPADGGTVTCHGFDRDNPDREIKALL